MNVYLVNIFTIRTSQLMYNHEQIAIHFLLVKMSRVRVFSRTRKNLPSQTFPNISRHLQNISLHFQPFQTANTSIKGVPTTFPRVSDPLKWVKINVVNCFRYIQTEFNTFTHNGRPVHKMRNAIFFQFWPMPPLVTFP